MAINPKFNYIARLLKEGVDEKGNFTGYQKFDRNLLNAYEAGDSTLEETIYWFRKNNKVADSVYIDPKDFKGWLSEQGYHR